MNGDATLTGSYFQINGNAITSTKVPLNTLTSQDSVGFPCTVGDVMLFSD